jgi:hypothetical protein
MLKYNWKVNIKGQQHNVQLQMDTILRFFGSGSGRLLVDGSSVRDWGCNPFRMIPKGSCEFEIDGKKASIRSKFAWTSLFFLVLDEQEIPPVEARGRKARARRNR